MQLGHPTNLGGACISTDDKSGHCTAHTLSNINVIPHSHLSLELRFAITSGPRMLSLGLMGCFLPMVRSTNYSLVAAIDGNARTFSRKPLRRATVRNPLHVRLRNIDIDFPSAAAIFPPPKKNETLTVTWFGPLCAQRIHQ